MNSSNAVHEQVPARNQEREALIALINAVRTSKGERDAFETLYALDDAELHRLADDTVQRVKVAQAGTVPALRGDYDMLDAKLGRIILDGINHDIRIMQALRALKNYFTEDFPRARARSRARRLDINMGAAAPSELASLLSAHKLPVVPEVIGRIKEVRKSNPEVAGELARSIADMKMTPSQSLFIAFALHAAGEVSRPARLLASVEEGRLNAGQAQRYNRILSEAEVLTRGPEAIADELIDELRSYIAPRLSERPPREGFCMAYVAASTLPYNKVGYTTRTHRVVQAIDAAARANNGELIVVARPGFPFDRTDLDSSALADQRHSDVGGIRYHYLESPIPMQDSLRKFALAAAAELANFFVEHAVDAVTAASNHVNAMAALIAARALDLPFTYEVRGLWEETRAAKRPGWEKTERYRVERLMESFVIASADTTFFITRQVRELFFTPEQIENGQRAYLAPNCAVLDEDRPQVRSYDSNENEVLELLYVGSLVEYEGLQLLLDALANMADRDRYRLTIVGSGSFAVPLREQAKRLQLDDIVHFVGRVDPSDVGSYFDRAHIVMVPRLPHRVCKLVSPLKPLEAMSYGRVCLVSDVAPMADLVQDGKTGFLFAAGNQSSLEDALRRVYDSQLKFQDIAEAGLDYLVRHRDWRNVGEQIYTVNLKSTETTS